MKLDDLLKEIEEDSRLDIQKLDREALKIPMLHAKYYRIWSEETSRLRMYYSQMNALRRELYEYYTGKAPDEEYNKKPLEHRILKTDVQLYMDADERMNDMASKLDFQKNKVELIEKFMNQLSRRGFDIKSAIEFQKLQNGVY